MIRMAAIGVANVGAKRGHLDLRGILDHKDHSEFRAHGKATRKKFLNAFRARIRANVVIRGIAAQFQIAHASAHEIRLMVVLAQCLADLLGQLARCHL
jgi:hypothetical protein